MGRSLSQCPGQGLDAKLTDAAKDALTAAGYDPVFGARPLKRVMQRQILNPMSQRILAGELQPGDVVHIDAVKGDLVFNTETEKRISK